MKNGFARLAVALVLFGVQSIHLQAGNTMTWRCVSGQYLTDSNGKPKMIPSSTTIADADAMCAAQGTTAPKCVSVALGRQDGCSGPNITEPWKTNFKAACDDHDICYSTPGASQAWCDSLLQDRANHICDLSYSSPGSPYDLCKQMAGVFYTAVSLAGQGSFNNDQSATENDACCRNDAKCFQAVWKNRECSWRGAKDKPNTNDGLNCYVNSVLTGKCNSSWMGSYGLGLCVNTPAQQTACNRANKGKACYYGLTNLNPTPSPDRAGWCGVDEDGTSHCVEMDAECDSSCQAAISRRCDKDAADSGLKCYEGTPQKPGHCRTTSPGIHRCVID